ncbi:hypothetical protein IY230_05925 [Acholeplasma laidlawii]|uniref:hypothetical protein n=1 Tax=Acholeplasma laidlawii TaxID=2148 RepID=UPI0018C30C64|nr:hypothetical protein [Acholeplasma laidlawii]MBG0763139.1 hypothetical protein [Acholeplasma laidlawii]
MSKLEAIIALENQVEQNIENAKKEKEAMLEKARLEVKQVIDTLKQAQLEKINHLQKEADLEVEAITKENDVAKEKLRQKIETDYKDVTSKYLELLKKEVISK